MAKENFSWSLKNLMFNFADLAKKKNLKDLPAPKMWTDLGFFQEGANW